MTCRRRAHGRMGAMALVGLTWFVGLATSCKRTLPRGGALPIANLAVGACGEPLRHGVLSRSPELRRADRDLNGDGVAEAVRADATMCDDFGNCYWNIFSQEDGGCWLYMGALRGRALSVVAGDGESRHRQFRDLRAYFALAERRLMVEHYAATPVGYQLRDAVLCMHETSGDLLQCEPSQQR